jgi:hypothetical protein
MHTAGAVVCNSRPAAPRAAGWRCRRTPIPCDLPIALRRRSPAGTMKTGFWVRIRVRGRGVGPLKEGRSIVSAIPGWLMLRRCCLENPGMLAGAAGGAPERTEGEKGCRARAGTARGVRARGAVNRAGGQSRAGAVRRSPARGERRSPSQSKQAWAGAGRCLGVRGGRAGRAGRAREERVSGPVRPDLGWREKPKK